MGFDLFWQLTQVLVAALIAVAQGPVAPPNPPVAADPCQSAADRAYVLLDSQSFTEAIDLMNSKIADCPESPAVFGALGRAYYSNYEYLYNGDRRGEANPDDMYRAITDLSKAIELDHNFWQAYYYRGAAFASFGQAGHALDDYAMTLQINPDAAITYYMRAQLYESQGAYADARQDYRSFLDQYGAQDSWRTTAEERLRAIQKKR